MSDTQTSKRGELELILTRTYDATPGQLYRAWTTPELLKPWFCPKPWTVVRAEMDVRPGGASLVVMRGPDGTEFPNPGQYLELVPDRRIVFTDAYVGDWQHSPKPFMTVTLDFEPLPGGRTRYTAVARHWTAEDCQAHEQMGFHQGWSIVADQLAEELARTR